MEGYLFAKIKYRKIPIISPGFIFVQKAFLLGLFSGELIIGGNFALQNGFGLTIKTVKNTKIYLPTFSEPKA